MLEYWPTTRCKSDKYGHLSNVSRLNQETYGVMINRFH